MSRASRDGTIHTDGDRATITFQRRLPHPIERVWAAITDPAERGAWFGPTTIDAREGGRIDMVSEGPPAPEAARRMSGRILAWDPPRLFEHEWHQSIVGETVVRYELAEDGAGTLLTFTHARLRVRDAKGYIPGEHAYLDRLEARLDGEPLPAWTERYAMVLPTYA